MVDDTLYITPHEAALACVATSMKKSRVSLTTLFVDSVMGAILFSTGGMLYVMCEAQDKGLLDRGAGGIVSLFQGAVYALGLFFVIETGMELFNSNVLFFTVGVLRGAVTIVDLAISWMVSFWTNLGATIFVVYVICYVSGIFKQPEYVEGTIHIAQRKIQASFMETFLRGTAGNFCVCLAVYLQMMVKPPHVKFMMIFLPIFTFVAMGFTHVVADMFMVPAGIFNHCGYGFGRYFWKIMLPGFLGNVVGGVFFSVMIPWYLHLVVIEQDMKKLNLPAYEEKDEQPMLNMDSRVVRVPKARVDDDEESPSGSTLSAEKREALEHDNSEEDDLSPVTYKPLSRTKTARHRKIIRSPKGVFPVADMGRPLKRERTIAYTYGDEHHADDEEDDSLTSSGEDIADVDESKMSTSLMKVISRRKSKPDLEQGTATGENVLTRLKTRISHARNVRCGTTNVVGSTGMSDQSRSDSVKSITASMYEDSKEVQPPAKAYARSRRSVESLAYTENPVSIYSGSSDPESARRT